MTFSSIYISYRVLSINNVFVLSSLFLNRNIDRSPVEFRVLDGASMSVMNLPQPIEARYLRLNLMNYTANPCMRLELMGCQKQSCNDVNECLKNNGGCQQKCLNRYV